VSGSVEQDVREVLLGSGQRRGRGAVAAWLATAVDRSGRSRTAGVGRERAFRTGRHWRGVTPRVPSHASDIVGHGRLQHGWGDYVPECVVAELYEWRGASRCPGSGTCAAECLRQW